MDEKNEEEVTEMRKGFYAERIQAGLGIRCYLVLRRGGINDARWRYLASSVGIHTYAGALFILKSPDNYDGNYSLTCKKEQSQIVFSREGNRVRERERNSEGRFPFADLYHRPVQFR